MMILQMYELIPNNYLGNETREVTIPPCLLVVYVSYTHQNTG